jgi:hypothetical protein
MDPIVANALKEKRELQRRLAEIEQFLALYEYFSNINQTLTEMAASVENWEHRESAPSRESAHRSIRSGPRAVVDVCIGILQDHGQPLTRGELAAELELRKVHLPGKDKESRSRYVGTVLWRNRDRFENLEGKGYWLKDVPIPETDQERRELREQATMI